MVLLVVLIQLCLNVVCFNFIFKKILQKILQIIEILKMNCKLMKCRQLHVDFAYLTQLRANNYLTKYSGAQAGHGP